MMLKRVTGMQAKEFLGSGKVTFKKRAKTQKLRSHTESHENVSDKGKDGLGAEGRKNLESWTKGKKGSGP